MASDKLMNFDEALEKYDPVMGFEVHVELNTNTKMFCGCANEFGSEPNTNVCPVCLGLPGALPAVNKNAVESSIKLGLALGCDIANYTKFSRKQYFYPDTPKNFQTSQYDNPIAENGSIEIELENGNKCQVKIERAHMEEDAGKLTHQGVSGRIQDAGSSLVDYNRAGVPLVEIVTYPVEVADPKDAPELARTYVAAIREIVKNLGISDAKMERGNVRCDANVSLKPKGAKKLGTRTETKNINSLRAIEKAIRYEIQRHAHILDSGEKIIQETRHWQETTGGTSSGRLKSDADDYRYFPEPDLVPIAPSEEWVAKLKETLPEPPAERRKRLHKEWGYSDLEFRDVVNAGLLDEIEETIATGATPAVARKWWMGEVARRANSANVEIQDLGVTPQTIVSLDELIKAGKINDKIAREVLDGVLAGEGNPEEVVTKRGLEIVSDDSELSDVIDKVLDEQKDAAEKIKNGKIQAVGAIVGGVMRETRGKADAAKARQMILDKLDVEG
ncbi:MAG: Asp-tRNA(Asn)/Glu-tRNA(Gln) amidotransferase subunit GatB [Micrococcaceae bacterium]